MLIIYLYLSFWDSHLHVINNNVIFYKQTCSFLSAPMLTWINNNFKFFISKMCSTTLFTDITFMHVYMDTYLGTWWSYNFIHHTFITWHDMLRHGKTWHDIIWRQEIMTCDATLHNDLIITTLIRVYGPDVAKINVFVLFLLHYLWLAYLCISMWLCL